MSERGDDFWRLLLTDDVAERAFWSQLLDDDEFWRSLQGMAAETQAEVFLKRVRSAAPQASRDIDLLRAEMAALIAHLVDEVGLQRARAMLKERQH